MMKNKTTPIYDRKCIYTGRRLSGKKVFQRFELLPEKKEVYYSGIRGVVIGYTYPCSEKSMPTRPQSTEDERVDNPEWDAGDALVDAHHAEKRSQARMNAKSKPALRAALDSIRPLVSGLSYYDARNLIEFLVVESKKKARKR